MNVCYPGNGQKDKPVEARDVSGSKGDLCSSPSLSPSLGDSIESSGSPSLSSPKDSSSPQSPSGPAQNVKKREAKGKSKESKGLRKTLQQRQQQLWWTVSLITCYFGFTSDDSNEPSPAGKPKRRFPDFG